VRFPAGQPAREPTSLLTHPRVCRPVTTRHT